MRVVIYLTDPDYGVWSMYDEYENLIEIFESETQALQYAEDYGYQLVGLITLRK